MLIQIIVLAALPAAEHVPPVPPPLHPGSKAYSPHEPRPDGGLWVAPSVTTAAFDRDPARVAAAYWRSPMNRPGTDWGAWVAEWDLAAGKRTVVKTATEPVLFIDDRKLAMALYERNGVGPQRMSKRMALWKLGEEAPYQVLERGPGSDDSVLAACCRRPSRLVTVTDALEVVVWELWRAEKPPLTLGKVIEGERAGGARIAAVLYDPSGMESVAAIAIPPFQPRRVHAVRWDFAGNERREFREAWRWEGPLSGPPAGLRLDLPERSAGPLPLEWFPQLVRPEVRRFYMNSDMGLVLQAYCSPGPRLTLAVERALISGDSREPLPGTALAFSDDGKRLALGGPRGVVRIWDVEARRIERTLRLDDRPAESFRAAAPPVSLTAGGRKRMGEPGGLRANGADVVVLPELTFAGLDAAEPVPGSATEAAARAAREAGIYLAATLAEVDPRTGKRYSAAVLLDPLGRPVIHVRKPGPLAPDEAAWASPGDLGHPVADTPFGRLAFLLGGDLEAEATALAELKVDVALHPMAAAGAAPIDRLADLARRRGLAIVAAAPGAGSAVIGRDGTVLARPASEEPGAAADLPLPGR